MVVSGFPDSVNNDVELIDLTDQGRTCRKPSPYPAGSSLRAPMGTYIHNVAIVCGGSPYTDKCHVYNPQNGTWIESISMTVPRGYSGTTILKDNWWITGGYNYDEDMLSSTEYLDNSTRFVPYDDLPVATDFHVMVNVDGAKVMILSSYYNDYNKRTLIFDVESETWSDGPELNAGREKSQAGLVIFENGTRAVVAATGLDEPSTEYLNLDDNVWKYGPTTPYEIQQGASVQLNDTFIIVGGQNLTNVLDTLWTIDPINETWVLRDQKLSIPRYHAAAFLVPDDFC